MIAQPATPFISSNDYLAAEADSPIKHEYRQGQAYAMAGASNNHVLIAGNLFALLRFHVRGRGCRAFISDTKVHIETLNTYYYPDVVVSCDDRDRSFDNFLRYPCLIVEVLSESTEAFDRGDKFADYRHLDSLQEYVLISQNKQRIDRFQRNEQGLWALASCEGGDRLQLSTLNFDCAIAEIYEDVNFDAIAT